jgi:glycerophosphoryl diester phosphodiesterase
VKLREQGRTLRIGHRGAAALAPENTLRSLACAIELGCDLVEFDVLDLEDGTLVLAHSDDLAEVSHGAATGRVRTKTLAELRAVAPALPTLDEALAFVHDRSPATGLHVDLKASGCEHRVVEALRRRAAVERTVVSSFRPESLRAVALLEPSLARGLTYPHDRRRLRARRLLAPVAAAMLAGLRMMLPARVARMLGRSEAQAAMLYHGVVSRRAVERAHAAGAAVFAWTVDEPADLERPPDLRGYTLTP